MKVLLIDDEQSIVDVFTQVLQTGGYQVVSSLTGYDGIEKAKQSMPDLILLDQVMPDITGNQVLQLLKQDPTTQKIPVAMLSNFNQDTLVKDAINLGAIDYILKYQISPQDIIERIGNLLSDQATKNQPAAQAPTTPPASTPSSPSMPSTPQTDNNKPAEQMNSSTVS